MARSSSTRAAARQRPPTSGADRPDVARFALIDGQTFRSSARGGGNRKPGGFGAEEHQVGKQHMAHDHARAVLEGCADGGDRVADEAAELVFGPFEQFKTAWAGATDGQACGGAQGQTPVRSGDSVFRQGTARPSQLTPVIDY